MKNVSLFNSVVLNVSAMTQEDVFIYLLSSKEPTTIKALGTFLHNAFMKNFNVGQSSVAMKATIKALGTFLHNAFMKNFNVGQSSVAMKINDVYCNENYSIVKTRPLYTSRF